MSVHFRLHSIALAITLAAGPAAPVAAQQEVPVEVVAGGHILSGTLALPAGDGPFPAAVLISGSGRSDRNESLPGVAFQPFAQLAADLQAAGIATLRYDDRGVGRSTGDFHSATSFDFADDAEAAVGFLAARPEIAGGAIGLIGHSEGGMVAPIVAARNSQVAFVVSMAGTAVPGYDILSGQLRAALAELPAKQRETFYASEIAGLDLTVAEDWQAVEQLLRDEHAAMHADQKAQVGSIDEYLAQGLIYFRGWLHTFVTHDPARDWRLVDQPVLGLFGGRDSQVDAELNAPALTAALLGNGDATVIILPTANHLFQNATTGTIEEYPVLPAAFAPGFSQAIVDFINASMRSILRSKAGT